MSNTVTIEAEATRDELIAEWVARDAVATLQNRVRMILSGSDEDVLAKMFDNGQDVLASDERCTALFSALWPGDEDTEGHEYLRAEGEACYLAARLMRAIVYHADYLRDEVQHLFEVADKLKRQAAEASADA